MNQPADKDQQGNPSQRPAYARLKEEQERVAGGGRWSVDGSRRCCHRCGEEILRGTQFWTVLRPAEQEPQAGEGVAAYFSRQDHCESCLESLPPEQHFARWKTSIPAPEGPPRRIVNLASLHATFLSLIDSGQDSTAGDAASQDESGEQKNEPQTEPVPGAVGGLLISREADRARLAYLLALFLVRKRALRWQQHEGDQLIVSERSGHTYRVPVPRIDSSELEAAVSEFEQLLG